MPPAAVLDQLHKQSRDNARTPMQWDTSPNAGFTTGQPWLPLADDYPAVNVAAARDDPRSMLTLHRRLIALRRAAPALAVGSYAPVPAEGDLLAYRRAGNNRRFLIVLNLGDAPRVFTPAGTAVRGRITLTTHLDREGEAVDGALDLRPHEGLIVELTDR
jgi:alpha-glucosidase